MRSAAITSAVTPARRVFLKSAVAGVAAVAAPSWLRARVVDAAEAGVLDRLGRALWHVADRAAAALTLSVRAVR